MAGRIRRALISVSDKAGLVEFARALIGHSVELISTGGTARTLREAGLQVKDVSELTGFPEMLGGRVKTLHPRVHGGILAIRDNQEHDRQVSENGIDYIDMVVVNLYPFVETVSRRDVKAGEAIENIDIGGPSMIRSAAKNFEDVAIVTSPEDYEAVRRDMDSSGGAVSLPVRLALAKRAFETTARYDMAIAEVFADSMRIDEESGAIVFASNQMGDGGAPGQMPHLFGILATKKTDLRYGENPHQRAALYGIEGAPRGVATAEQLHGKELSFNNLVDLEAAWALVSEIGPPACAVIKHTNPCGAATAGTLAEAFEKALATDPVSAYGGIIGFNRTVTEAAAALVGKTFFEAVIAPGFDPGALDVLRARKNLRVMRMGEGTVAGSPYRIQMIGGGLLVQDADRGTVSDAQLKVVSVREPVDEEMRALRFAWIVAKHVKSNAIVYARDGQLVGVGAGQMSRVDSAKIGAMKAQLPLAGSVLASDAYFPFRDGVDEAARAGVTAIIQPGGSVRDGEVITAANEHNLAMVFTGMRHFKH
ncbi:MAG TPA: bifunctional phosphoribosylaminoimidazolecarboxamide formyltransferase/IMP cyclohydrolase [Blastocatellia bacterium]|nr:bifunctional phosphoribosylaminoimidazolecarboxamide formyltransferase/IMP cyclohydrolase [Blastocatellia bacterium]